MNRGLGCFGLTIVASFVAFATIVVRLFLLLPADGRHLVIADGGVGLGVRPGGCSHEDVGVSL